MKRLLVVEDELALQNILVMGLTSFGYCVDGANDGRQALDLYYEKDYDLIVLDLNIPYIDGIELLKEFHLDNLGINIIVLSARSDVDDKIKGINLGANDYLAKPFNFEELVARINALLRREFVQNDDIIRFDDYLLNNKEKKLTYKNIEIKISQKEFEILSILFIGQKSIVQSNKLILYLWENDSGSIKKLKALINVLRKKLPTELIKNKWGVGYYVSKI